jgi:hypothetical protein
MRAPVRLRENDGSIRIELVPVIEESIAQQAEAVRSGETIDNLLGRQQAVGSNLLP